MLVRPDVALTFRLISLLPTTLRSDAISLFAAYLSQDRGFVKRNRN